MSHTILLVQQTSKTQNGSFIFYTSVNECMEGVWNMYEDHLKAQHPDTPFLRYDLSQLFDYLDQLPDISCLVYQESTSTYAPYNRHWIKEKIYLLMKRQADVAEDMKRKNVTHHYNS